MKVWLLAMVMVAVVGCKPSGQEAGPKGKPVVMTTFYPTTYFAERIAGDRIDLQCPLPEGEDPIFWMPDSETITAYQQADLIILNGAELEKWVTKVSLPNARILESARIRKDDFLFYKQSMTHSHGPKGDHTHKGVDGHTWVDPDMAKSQAEAIVESLRTLLPGAQLDGNFQALATDLRGLDQRLEALSAIPRKEHMLASHPAYNYLKQRYQWKLSSLDLDPETLPDAKQQEYIASLLEGWPSKIILWESAPSPEVAKLFEETFTLKNVVFSPCENRPEDGKDYLSVMNENLRRLEEALTPPASE